MAKSIESLGKRDTIFECDTILGMYCSDTDDEQSKRDLNRTQKPEEHEDIQSGSHKSKYAKPQIRTNVLPIGQTLQRSFNLTRTDKRSSKTHMA